MFSSIANNTNLLKKYTPFCLKKQEKTTFAFELFATFLSVFQKNVKKIARFSKKNVTFACNIKHYCI